MAQEVAVSIGARLAGSIGIVLWSMKFTLLQYHCLQPEVNEGPSK